MQLRNLRIKQKDEEEKVQNNEASEPKDLQEFLN
jgi:hypothetical protein